MEKMFTVKEAAALLPNNRGGIGVAPALVYDLIKQGRIKTVPDAQPMQVSAEALEQYIANYDPQRHHYQITDDQVLVRIVAVLTGKLTITEAALAEPAISVSSMSRFISGERRSHLLEQAKELVERTAHESP